MKHAFDLMSRRAGVGLALALLPIVASAQAPTPQKMLDPTPLKTGFFTPDEMKGRLGSLPVTGSSTKARGTALPFPVDKNFPSFYVIPVSKRPAILNQGSYGTCVSYATTTAMATLVANHPNRFMVPPLTIADPLLFFISAGRSLVPMYKKNVAAGILQDDPRQGWYIRPSGGVAPDAGGPNRMVSTGASISMNLGVVESGMSKMVPLDGFWIKAGKSGEITDTSPLPAGMTKHDVMRKFIASQGALVADYSVYSDFNQYQSGIYNHSKFVDLIVAPFADNPSLPALTRKTFADTKKALTAAFNKVDGYHAVTVIGYFAGGKLKLSQMAEIFLEGGSKSNLFGNTEVDAPAFWIVQNSWGDKWGSKGIFLYEANQSMDNQLDDSMTYLLEPIVTNKGKRIL